MMHLRSVELQMPDRRAAVDFLQGPWGLREAATRVLTETFGFRLSDRTRVMNFLRCDDLHHVVAYADSKQATLNHIAFEMQDTDSVMRGMGRLKDAGYASVWGPGRHGPGN